MLPVRSDATKFAVIQSLQELENERIAVVGVLIVGCRRPYWLVADLWERKGCDFPDLKKTFKANLLQHLVPIVPPRFGYAF